MSQKTKQHKPYQNTFETVTDFGVDTVKQALGALNPLAPVFEKTTNTPHRPKDKGIETPGLDEKMNRSHTPLDFNKLDTAYKNQDQQKVLTAQQKLQQLNQIYFRNVKTGEEQAILKNKQKEEEKKRQEAMEAQEKERQDVLAQQEGIDNEAHGRQQGKLGQPRRKATVQYENKAQIGK